MPTIYMPSFNSAMGMRFVESISEFRLRASADQEQWRTFKICCFCRLISVDAVRAFTLPHGRRNLALAPSGLRRYADTSSGRSHNLSSITIERTVDDQAVPPAAFAFLTVGLGVQLALSQDKANTLYGTSILGWKQDSWLICEWPFHLGTPISCDSGTQVLLRYFHQGKMIGYCSEVLDACVQPFPFLLLSFPLTLEEMPLR